MRKSNQTELRRVPSRDKQEKDKTEKTTFHCLLVGQEEPPHRGTLPAQYPLASPTGSELAVLDTRSPDVGALLFSTGCPVLGVQC